MKSRFASLALLLVVAVIATGCSLACPSPSSTQADVAAVADTRGAIVPTDTPVSPLPSPTTISPLAAPTQIKSAEANAVKPAATPVIAPEDVEAATLVDYVVGHGDTLAKIALRYGSTAQDILDANPTLKRADLIFVGQHLTVPARLPAGETEPEK